MTQKKTTLNKLLSCALALTLLASLLTLPAGAISETEPNNAPGSATRVGIGETVTGSVQHALGGSSNTDDNDDWIAVTVDRPGVLSFDVTMRITVNNYGGAYFAVYLPNANGEQKEAGRISKDPKQPDYVDGAVFTSQRMRVNPGTYLPW